MQFIIKSEILKKKKKKTTLIFFTSLYNYNVTHVLVRLLQSDGKRYLRGLECLLSTAAADWPRAVFKKGTLTKRALGGERTLTGREQDIAAEHFSDRRREQDFCEE